MRSNNKILILQDYRGTFYSTVRSRFSLCTFDLELLQSTFSSLGYEPILKQFSELDFRADAFAGIPVVYQSSEDAGLYYKGYIEDILLAIKLRGGVLVPSFEFFRAHHNKVFMELLRDLCPVQFAKSIRSRYFGTAEEFAKSGPMTFPMVLKKAEGAGSNGVKLAHTKEEALRISRQFSFSATPGDTARELGKRILRKGYHARSIHRKKFVTQTFVPGLSADYKVLVYGDKYYVVERKNRKNDFRASGSGLISWPTEPPGKVLDAAMELYAAFNVPCASLDIAFDGRQCFLIEAQFIMFGPLAAERSKWHFVFYSGHWQRVEGTSSPEVEFARSVVQYLERKSEEARSVPIPFDREQSDATSNL